MKCSCDYERDKYCAKRREELSAILCSFESDSNVIQSIRALSLSRPLSLSQLPSRSAWLDCVFLTWHDLLSWSPYLSLSLWALLVQWSVATATFVSAAQPYVSLATFPLSVCTYIYLSLVCNLWEQPSLVQTWTERFVIDRLLLYFLRFLALICPPFATRLNPQLPPRTVANGCQRIQLQFAATVQPFPQPSPG